MAKMPDGWIFIPKEKSKTEFELVSRELVCCRNCKWWDQKDDSSYGYCRASDHWYRSKHWEISIYRVYQADWFCADGERREKNE